MVMDASRDPKMPATDLGGSVFFFFRINGADGY